jgi:hypothetical protein
MNKLAKRAKLPRATKEEFMEVIRLHERMNHMASHIMAMAIRNGAWTGALIPAATIERVFKHYDCEACKLAKARKELSQLGSGLRPA